MVVMVFRRMASSPTPSKLGQLPLVHFRSPPYGSSRGNPCTGSPPESTDGGDKVLTISTRFLYNDETKLFVYHSSRVLGSLAPHKHPPITIMDHGGGDPSYLPLHHVRHEQDKRKWVVWIRVTPYCTRHEP